MDKTDLAALGVDPDYQRQGLARMLMPYDLERADEDGLPIYLGSSVEATSVYPRLGFKVKGEAVRLNDRYTMPAMIRPAKGRR